LGCVVPGGIGLDLVDKPSSFSAMTLGWVVWSVKSSCKVSNGMLNRTMPCHIHVMSNTVLVLSTEQGHCGACRMKWWLTDTDLCPCGETQTMFYIVESCPLTKLNCGLSRLRSADEDAVLWLTSYGSWHAYEKKKKIGAYRRNISFEPSSKPLHFWYLLHCVADCRYPQSYN